MGMYLIDLAPLVLRYRRAQREIALLLDRERRIRAVSFNLNVFSSSQSLALFRFEPQHIRLLAGMPQVEVAFPRARSRATTVEFLAIVWRGLPRRVDGMIWKSCLAGVRPLCAIFFTPPWRC